MKKNVLLRTLAGMSAIAILGVSTIIGASAAPEDKITMSIDKVTGKAGETVTVAVNLKNNPGFEGFGAVIDFDEALTAEDSYDSGSLLTKNDTTMVNLFDDYLIFSGGTTKMSTASEGTLMTFDFTIPVDAELDKVYDITWSKLDDLSNATTEFTDEVNLVDGSITVIGEEEETTPAETDAETEAETTTAATVVEAPKTGSSTKGIAATSAVLLAAACSAVVLKKKRD